MRVFVDQMLAGIRKNRRVSPEVCFRLLLAAYGLVILATFTDYGITTDEGHHVEYGHSVVRWYASVGRERWVFSWSDVWLYGGFYDTLSHLATRISPFSVYDTRHLCNALTGLLGVIGAYRLGRVRGGGWAGFLSAAFLVLTPRYYGHTFINHKDMPFAVLYLWSVYGLLRAMEKIPDLPWNRLVGVGVVMGLTKGVRVGGMILIGYLMLFWGIRYW